MFFLQKKQLVWLVVVALVMPCAYATPTAPLPVYPVSQTVQNIVSQVANFDGADASDVPSDDLPILDNPNPLVGNITAHVPLNAISPETLRTFVGVVDLVRRKYDGQVDDEMLFHHAMNGMLARLDGHAEFLDAEAFRNLQAFTEGNIAHVGLTAEFVNRDNQWVVTEVEPSSSAQLFGIEVGDYLYKIGDKKLDATLMHRDVSQLLSGIAGTQVDVMVSKAGRGKRTVTLQRTSRANEQLSVIMEGDIVVVQLPIFTARTRQDLIEALAHINQPVRGIVLDVRNNPGGVLSSALSVASLFMDKMPVVQIIEKGTVVQTLSTSGDAPLADMPVMVLQNRYSASAAEILAQALKQDKEAVIVGERSYGKGSIQSIIPLGGDEAVKLTTAHYATLAGDKIDGVGVTPNVLLDYQDPTWFIQAIELMQKYKLEQGVMIYLPDDY